MTMTVRDRMLIRLDEVEQKVEKFSERAAVIFSTLGLTWNNLGTGAYIPSKGQIAGCLYGLIRGVRAAVMNDVRISKGYSFHFRETGRLKVEVSHSEDGEIECDMTMMALGDHEV